MTFLRRFAFVVLLSLCPLLHAQTPTDITSQLTFTTIDVPGAGATFAMGMNSAGDIVGLYGKTNNNDRYRGFLLNFNVADGSRTSICHGLPCRLPD